ncbi:MAG: hypothetical protein AAGF11_20740 [Myxococcota bacterium]
MKRHTLSILGASVLTSLVLSGCNRDRGTEPEPTAAVSTRNHLVWKRYHAVEQDLSRALELAPDELCTELGRFRCVDEVHLAGLGGHDPFRQGLYEPLSDPLATTSLALERVALSACGTRVERDRTDPVVFTALALDEPAPAADSEAFTKTAQTLYRRLLSRDPEDSEQQALADLLVDDEGERLSSAEFAHLACFAVATTTEFSFI